MTVTNGITRTATTSDDGYKSGGTSPPDFTPLHPGLEAVYVSHGVRDATRLPVVGVDGRGRALVMTRKGRVVLATRARPQGERPPFRPCYFAGVEREGER